MPKKYDNISFTAPDTVKANYRRGLDKHEEGLSGDGLERQTVEVAKEIVAGESISPEWARKGNRWWGRNERFLDEDEDSAAYTAAMLWGGAAGRDWFASLMKKMDKADKKTAQNFIKKQGGEWCVYGESGRNMGCYSTKAEADKRLKQIERFSGNKAMVTVTNAVDASKIREEVDEYGDTIIIVPSYTLPDDVVMNGGLYPAEEIEASYMTLDGTPAPLGHPVTKSGDFISASSEIGVHNYQCGVFNGAVDRQNGRVYVEKRINKRVAMQSERGKRVLDRVEAFMKGEGDPIHTSTGIFLDVEEVEATAVNASGDEYNWIARNMIFDHDAILLDEDGAATPDKGVGMMVNSKLHTNLDESENDKREALWQAVKEEFTDGDDVYAWLVDYDDDQLIYESKYGYFQISYSMTESGEVSFIGESVEVKRKTMWQAIANWFSSICGNNSDQLQSNQYGRGGRIISNLNEGNDMSFRQKLIDQLKANKVELDYDNVTDDQLLEAVNKTATNEAEEEPTPAPAVESDDKVLEAVNALTTKVTELETKLNAKEEDEMKAMRDYLKKNGDYEDGEVDDMGNKAVKSAYKRMKGNAQDAPAFFPGAAGDFAANSQSDQFSTELPE